MFFDILQFTTQLLIESQTVKVEMCNVLLSADNQRHF